MIIRVFILSFFVLLLEACSSPKDANEENFSKAIQDYLDQHYLDLGDDYCITFRIHPEYTARGDPRAKVFEKVGFVKLREIDTSGVGIDTYGLTDKGKKVFQEEQGFCLGKKILVRIINFSEPHYGDRTLSSVNYEYKHTVPDWAVEVLKLGEDEDWTRFQHAYDKLHARVNSPTNPIKEKGTLILTNNGWVHEDLF